MLMFFNISKERNNDFPEHVEYGGFSIDLDPGWYIHHNDNSITISKGLSESSCVIYCKGNKIKINPGYRRTFPIFYNNTSISNIINYEHSYYQQEELVLEDITLAESEEPLKYIDLGMTDEQLFEHLYKYLDGKIKSFDPKGTIDVFPTGGVDTMLIMSFILKHKKKYRIVDAEYKAQDYFVCHNRSKLGKFWAYRNIIYWREPHVLMTGGNGDEMMLRNPADAYLIGLKHNEDIRETLKTGNFYHSKYFQKSKHNQYYDSVDTTVTDYKTYILRRNYFDYQFWHLGNTLTWAPLNDLTICNIMLNFSYDTLRGQLLDASISKQIIERNNPKLMKYVSSSKNENGYKQLYRIFEGLESFS